MSQNKEKKIKIILDSGSKRRQELIESWGYDFEVKTSNVDEKEIRLDDPRELTLALAYAKAESLFPYTEKGSILLTSDTVLYLNGKIIEKLESKEEAREMFLSFKDLPLEAFTAVVVVNISTGKMLDGVDSAKIVFSEIPDDIINELLERDDTYKKAGGFDIEDPVLKPFLKFVKGEKETIIGLPKMLTQNLLKEIK